MAERICLLQAMLEVARRLAPKTMNAAGEKADASRRTQKETATMSTDRIISEKRTHNPKTTATHINTHTPTQGKSYDDTSHVHAMHLQRITIPIGPSYTQIEMLFLQDSHGLAKKKRTPFV